jgi:hypothetical protein
MKNQIFQKKQLAKELNIALRQLYKTNLTIFGEDGPAVSPFDDATEFDSAALVEVVTTEVNRRKSRQQYFSSITFREPAWDIIIDLFLARLLGKNISVSSACIASGVPDTTALQYLRRLEANDMIFRQDDPADHRRVWLNLTPDTFEAVKRWAISSAKIASRNKQQFGI